MSEPSLGPTSPNAGTLRVAIAGAGEMARHHATAIQRTEAPTTVVGIADPSEASLEEALKLCTGARGASSLDELLEDTAADIVHIVTPPSTHEDLTRKALEAGCHVYVEKPFAESARAARELTASAAARGLGLCAGHQLLFEAPSIETRELLSALGTPVHVESYFSFRPTDSRAGGRPPLRADLQLLDILPHPVYLLLDFLERLQPQGESEVLSVDVRPGGTVHALVGRGQLTGTLTVSLGARPVESYLDVVGTNGRVHADFVRSTVQRRIGPGSSGIDKLLDPYRVSKQMVLGTTVSLAGRVLQRKRSYPGLAEIFDAFYASILGHREPPLTAESIIDTVRVCSIVRERLEKAGRDETPAVSSPEEAPSSLPSTGDRRVLVTGGTGFLGASVVERLTERGFPVRVLSRRLPAPWDRVPGVEYVTADLADGLPPDLLEGVHCLVHCAAATSGGWEEHQRLSLDATEHVVRSMAEAGVKRLVHVSSLAVVARPSGGAAASESTPLEPDSRGSGPYVWGKLESERLAVDLGNELGVHVKVVRPGAIVDMDDFEPPGRLGKRVGNIFVAVGSPGDTLDLVDLDFAARAIAEFAVRFDDAPDVINLLSPEALTKRDLIARLRASNPDLTVVWLPPPVLVPLSWIAVLAQKLLRPGKPAVNAARVFAAREYDRSLSEVVARELSASRDSRELAPDQASMSLR